MYKRACYVLLAGLLLAIPAASQSSEIATATETTAVPQLIRFSGTLKSGDTVHGVTFSVYANQQGGAPLWTETQNVRPDATGKYEVLLGSTKTSGIPSDIFAASGGRWLGIRVEGEAEGPRMLMVSVPYALKAGEAQTITGHSPDDLVTKENLASVLHEQVQQGRLELAPGAQKSITSNSTPLLATTFEDSNSTQVVLIQQDGAGVALTALAGTGSAVVANTTATSGFANGVQASSASTSGKGIIGTASAATGTTYGIYGQAASTSGTGVRGDATAATGNTTALWGNNLSTTGTAIKATSSATTGNTIGLITSVASPSGTGAVIQNTASGPLISARAGATPVEQFGVDGSGNVNAKGSLNSTGLKVAGKGSVTSPTGIALQANSGTCPIPLSGVTTAVAACSDNNIPLYAYTGSLTQPALYVDADSTGPIFEGIGAGGGGITIDNVANVTTNGNLTAQNITANGTTTSNGVFTASAGITYGGHLYGLGDEGISGPLGVGTLTPRSTVEILNNNPHLLGPVLTITNNGTGLTTAGAIDFNTNAPSTTGFYNPTLRIAAIQTGTYTGDLVFLANKDGALNNGTFELFRMSAKNGLGPRVTASVPMTVTASVAPGAAFFAQNTYPNNDDEIGIAGEADGTGGVGVQGTANGTNGIGVNAHADSGTGLNATSKTGYAATFSGNVDVIGTMYVSSDLHVTGTLYKGGGSFQIDHPLDPANKLLSHSFVESPDMMNIYNGIVQLDKKGEAWIALPNYFEALNQDFRYQLTAIGRPAPKVYVAQEINDHRFKIAGGPANGKISWQVTGIRHDAWAQAHRIKVEEEKAADQQGKYLNPELFGAGKEARMGAAKTGSASPSAK